MLALAAKSWVSSPFGVNLLQSLFKDSNETVENFIKISHQLKEKIEFCTRNKVFSTPNNKQIELLKDVKCAERFDSLQDAVSIWVNANCELENINLTRLIPRSTELILTNISTFKSAWKTADCCYGALMKTYNSFSYTEDTKYEARILEYPLQDEKFNLIIIVPNQVDVLNLLFTRFANEGLRAAVNYIQPLFIVRSKLISPCIQFDSEGSFQEEINQFGKVTISHRGSINVNDRGVDIKVLSCIYPTSTISGSTKPDVQKADPPFFFSLLFQDTPIFVGQFNKIDC